MKFLFFGDIMGRAGRDALAQHLPALQAEHKPDFIVANAENAAAGYGLTLKIAADLFNLGIDVLTTGNHVWDQKELLSTIGNEPRILRPCNFPKDTPGSGSFVAQSKSGKKLLVINVMGRLFMDAMDDPFVATSECVAAHTLGKTVDGILIDVHCEASSEKQAIGHLFDGRVTAVLGTHTHVPTADDRILAKGTAFQTDTGMCGDYDSVIGMKKDLSVARMMRKYSFERLTPAEGEGTVCAALVESDDKTGLAKSITTIRMGGVLKRSE
ncbi:MAG: TIGR00282 family metallophosphoesterase [Alphaproteobacteria bacterium]|nr:TIGR00282 family metallophosphoesterase [Alphaproteobacteria bacterium]